MLQLRTLPLRAATAVLAVAFVSACEGTSPVVPDGPIDPAGLEASVSSHQAPGATPSTNDQNRDNGWAHFNVVDEDLGAVTLEFVTTRGFASCFEYRIDGEDPIDPDNFNPEIFDGLWPFACVSGGSTTSPVTDVVTLNANELVEVRMVFGAEKDERFDWTPILVASGKDACKRGGWADYGFRNQGQCIRYVNTGMDSR